MAIDIQLEVIESIKTRLRAIKGTYTAQAGNAEFVEIEDLAREVFVSLQKVSKNLAKMVELEREINKRSGPEIAACQKLLRAIAELPGIPN